MSNKEKYRDLVATFTWLAEPQEGCPDCAGAGFNCAMNNSDEVKWSYTAIARELRYRATAPDLREWIDANEEEASAIARYFFFTYDECDSVWRHIDSDRDDEQ